MTIRLALLAAGLAASALPAADPVRPLHRLVPSTPAELRALFRYTGEPLPFVSAHRGGAAERYPENCLATFEHTLRNTYAILEIDPRLTKDGQIVVHHDATLEHTTSGSGSVSDHTLEELRPLRLKDPAGRLTQYPLPTLDETLEWARGRTVLVLDQKDVPMAERVRKITEHKAEAYAMVIANSFKDVQACYAANPDVMLEVMIPNREKVLEFDRLGVPWANVVAFVGHQPPEDPELYRMIHERGALCMIGTSRNLDRHYQADMAAGLAPLESGYLAYLARGADLIETDIPVPLGALLFSDPRIPAAKAGCFRLE